MDVHVEGGRPKWPKILEALQKAILSSCNDGRTIGDRGTCQWSTIEHQSLDKQSCLRFPALSRKFIKDLMLIVRLPPYMTTLMTLGSTRSDHPEGFERMSRLSSGS
jgi:hypothetical protein